MNLAKVFSSSQSSLSSLDTLLGTTTSVGETFTPTKVVRICAQSAEEIDLIAEVLLLQESTKPTVLEPLAKGHKQSDCQDRITGTTRQFPDLLKGLQAHLKESNLQGIAESVRVLTEQVALLTESAAQLAYVTAVKDPMSEPALPGVTDRYSFEMAKFAIVVACRKFDKEKHGSVVDTQMILKISSTIAESLTVLKDGCKCASELQDLSVYDREQFVNSSKALQGATAPFLTAFKAFTKSRSEPDRLRCQIFCRPMVEAVKATVEFSQLPEFRGKPASLSEEAKGTQTQLLGSAMAVVSSVIQLFAATQNILEQPRFMNDSLWERWHMCSKAALDAAQRLQQVVKMQTPFSTPRRSTETPQK